MPALIAFAASASAHVTVTSPGAAQGGYSVVTFRVPNEEASATTTKVVMQLLTDTPIASVSLQPITGWTAVTTSIKLATPIKTDDGDVARAVSQITWTASVDTAIKPGEFQQFNAEMGPLPSMSSITVKALQTYSGKGHVMIGSLYGTLISGDEVNVELQFRNAGLVDVVAKVIPFGAPAPGEAASPGSASHSSGAHK
ncbi:MAG: DUF1775 domain-containing protein [Actinomycetota bacterium]|nr:DUF1775 domain-containing protein [Actinomycetota bacterium]